MSMWTFPVILLPCVQLKPVVFCALRQGLDTPLHQYPVAQWHLSGVDLLQLTSQDLEALGVHKIGHQELILEAVEKLCSLVSEQWELHIIIHVDSDGECISEYLLSCFCYAADCNGAVIMLSCSGGAYVLIQQHRDIILPHCCVFTPYFCLHRGMSSCWSIGCKSSQNIQPVLDFSVTFTTIQHITVKYLLWFSS